MTVAHSDLSGAMAFCKQVCSSSPVMQAVICIVTAKYCKLLRNRLFALPAVLTYAIRDLGFEQQRWWRPSLVRC